MPIFKGQALSATKVLGCKQKRSARPGNMDIMCRFCGGREGRAAPPHISRLGRASDATRTVYCHGIREINQLFQPFSLTTQWFWGFHLVLCRGVKLKTR